ncbi:MAG: F0F1 ATP synthase subunit A [Phycisphaerae bacterium]
MASANPLDHVVAHDIFKIGSITVNNHMIMLTVVAVIMLVVFPIVTRRRQMVPTGVRNFFEAICVYFRDEVARPMLHDQTDRFIGLIWTFFFFILFCNLLGMVPIGSILFLASAGKLKEIGGTPTGNIYVTGALASLMFIMIHVSGIWQNMYLEHHHGKPWPQAVVKGFFLYWYKLVPPIGGVIGYILFPLLFLLEFLGVASKSFALAVRLFANMLAGHTVLAIMLFFIALPTSYGMGLFVAGASVVGSVALSGLELFVAFLQAYIFTLLATVFIGMSVHQEH